MLNRHISLGGIVVAAFAATNKWAEILLVMSFLSFIWAFSWVLLIIEWLIVAAAFASINKWEEILLVMSILHLIIQLCMLIIENHFFYPCSKTLVCFLIWVNEVLPVHQCIRLFAWISMKNAIFGMQCYSWLCIPSSEYVAMVFRPWM